ICTVGLSDVSNTYTEAAIAKKLFVGEGDVAKLRSVVNDAFIKGETVYLLRFAVRDSYCGTAALYDCSYAFAVGGGVLSLAYKKGGHNYYFEKTVFLDFDVLTTDWVNEYGAKAVLPVAATPVNVVGTLTPPTGNDFGGNEVGDLPNTDLSPWVILLMAVAGVVLFCLLLVVLAKAGVPIGAILGSVVRFFGTLLNGLIDVVSGLGRSIGSVVSFGVSRSDSRREQARRDDENKRANRADERADHADQRAERADQRAERAAEEKKKRKE
ncbi:MAG: hypothetical protein IJX13_06540, partial [Clostridia bacterium]|nr:hypothetical protein [Clostridia bacterium]